MNNSIFKSIYHGPVATLAIVNINIDNEVPKVMLISDNKIAKFSLPLCMRNSYEYNLYKVGISFSYHNSINVFVDKIIGFMLEGIIRTPYINSKIEYCKYKIFSTYINSRANCEEQFISAIIYNIDVDFNCEYDNL